VRGGGIKPWRQKGTGRARQGSTRSPQWTHGGIALGPKPRDYGFAVNKKVRRLAIKSALSSKVVDDELLVVDDIVLEEIKTKRAAEILNALGTGKKTLLVLPQNNDIVFRSFRNIAGIKVIPANNINVYDILNCDTLLLLKATVDVIEAVYAPQDETEAA
jgi:large subunit ribosomal protein L4